MFLSDRYVLGNELVNKMQISTSNLSMLRKKLLQSDDRCTVRKLSNCLFVDTKSRRLPDSFKQAIRKIKNNEGFTKVHNLLPTAYVNCDISLNDEDFDGTNVVIGKIKLHDKPLYVFNEKFVEKVGTNIIYVLHVKEAEMCLKQNKINGFEKVNAKKCLAWY